MFSGVYSLLSLLYPAGLSRKHFVLMCQSVNILTQVCVCGGGRVFEEEKEALGKRLRAPAGAPQSLPHTMT